MVTGDMKSFSDVDLIIKGIGFPLELHVLRREIIPCNIYIP